MEGFPGGAALFGPLALQGFGLGLADLADLLAGTSCAGACFIDWCVDLGRVVDVGSIEKPAPKPE